jgi:hypothetical protein
MISICGYSPPYPTILPLPHRLRGGSLTTFYELRGRSLSPRAPTHDGLILQADAHIPPHLVLSLVIHCQVMLGKGRLIFLMLLCRCGDGS